MGHALPSLGLSPTFQAYLVAGSILAILAFLLYNESIIRQLRDQEKNNVDLYAKLISLAPLAEDEQSIAIFQQISINPSISFPIIVTDYTGRVTQFNNIELPHPGAARRSLLQRLAFWRRSFPDTTSMDSASSLEAILAPVIARMDAQNDPIPFYSVPEVTGRVYATSGCVVVTDAQGRPVQWQGDALPDPRDTTRAAHLQVEQFMRGLRDRVEPLVFKTGVGSPGYVYYDGRDVVVADRTNRVITWRGRDLPSAGDTTDVARKRVADHLLQMGAAGAPLTFQIPARSYIHYGDSQLVRRISKATYVQILALILFLMVAYVGIRNIRRSEQRTIWVGMAKETAHQLGTPLSSLSGWLELLDSRLRDLKSASAISAEPVDELRYMVSEMSRDMQRLSQIASRFSQIGSVPEHRLSDVVAILKETVAYFKSRTPQFGRHEIHLDIQGDIPLIPMNPDLIAWVFENLFKNAMDAMDEGHGTITVQVTSMEDPSAVRIRFSDTGRGIAQENLGRVFEPGFSTRKRGWGLGLAFARRIIEEYHHGRISVERSIPGEGTTFEIVLPRTQPT